jgi:hypothetical protein
VSPTARFDRVRKLGLRLPRVEVGTVYGSPALKVDGKMFACVAIHRSADPNSLAIRMEFDQRDELIAAEPDTYYLTDHYTRYPVVLIRLNRVHDDALRDLLRMGWHYVSTRRPVGPRTRK